MLFNQPKGLIPAALSNMGERFGYYIMNAVLVLFLCSKFGLSEEAGGLIYSFFYAGIYVLSLVGGFISDRTQNYKGTIISGLVVMSLGYLLLSIPILATSANQTWLLALTCVALFFVAFGNGLFKGNLQAIVGQIYDNYEAEAAKQGEEALAVAKTKRDTGFQIFYVFINIGGLIAPFVAPMLRSWWLKANSFTYNSQLPERCHDFLANGAQWGAEKLQAFTDMAANASHQPIADLAQFSESYLKIFNEGIHYSFIASVAAMVISLVIFVATKRIFPTPGKKVAKVAENYSQQEKMAMAKEIKQRMVALFAILGIVIFFWFSFHQNGASLSFFARDFVDTSTIAPEIWQAVNPFFVIALTPLIIVLFNHFARRGHPISTPRKIAYGMGLAGLAYLFLAIICMHFPSAADFRAMDPGLQDAAKVGPWVLIMLYFFLTVAELFISPLGLSFVSKVAPKQMQGLCQGLWLCATALGNLLLFIGPFLYNAIPIWQCWSIFLIVCLLSMGGMFAMVKWLERVTQ